jgi:uncharacterized protein YciI
MDGLAEHRFVLLGGPIGGSGRAMLIVDSASTEEVIETLRWDPWTMSDMLRVAALHPWDVLLGKESDVRPGRAQRTATSRYIVISEQGPAWQTGVPMREQGMWSAHAAAMDDMADERFVRLGGTLESADHMHRALLVVEAESEQAVRNRLEVDPWTATGILRIIGVHAWRILLGDLAD